MEKRKKCSQCDFLDITTNTCKDKVVFIDKKTKQIVCRYHPNAVKYWERDVKKS
jgi:hypothetical protein